MAEITNQLIYEVLKDVQHRIGRIEGDVRDVKSEIHAVRGYVSAIQLDIGNLYATQRELSERVDRIEKRLGMHDPMN